MAVAACEKWKVDEKFVEPENAKHKEIARKAFEGFVEIAEMFEQDSWLKKDPAVWKLEGSSKTTGDHVYTRTLHKNKAFVITGEMEGDLDIFEKITWDDIESTPSWFSAVTEYQRPLIIGSHTDVVYGVSAAAVGGLVSPRDVISARCKRRTATCFMQGGQSVELENMPEKKGRVRSIDYPFIMKFTLIKEKPGFCSFEWMSNTDIKGWVPSKVVNQFFSDTMYQYMEQMRTHIATMKH